MAKTGKGEIQWREAMNVEEIMCKEVVIIVETATVQEAVDSIVKYRVGCVLVVEKSNAVGIVTERDVLQKVVSPGKNPKLLKVKDIMSKPLITIEPDKSVEEAGTLMMDKKIKKLPVVRNGELVGILTATDIVANEPKHIAELAELMLKGGGQKGIGG